MANVQKYTKSNVSGGGLIQHFERKQDSNGEYHKWGNQDIDPSRSHLNYNLAPDRGSVMGGGEFEGGGGNGVIVDDEGSRNTVNSRSEYSSVAIGDGGQWDFLQKRLSEVYCHNREDVNVLCSWIITAPQSLLDGWDDFIKGGGSGDIKSDGCGGEATANQSTQTHPITVNHLNPTTKANLELFFNEAYKFLNDKYGNGTDKNVMSAYVHMDETTPHLHYAFVPVVWDEKKQREKVSAKEALDWSGRGLNKFHPELEAHMERVFGFEVGIINEATKDGNKTVTELKRQSALDEQQRIAEEQERVRTEALAEQSRIQAKILAEQEKIREQLRAETLKERERTRLEHDKFKSEIATEQEQLRLEQEKMRTEALAEHQKITTSAKSELEKLQGEIVEAETVLTKTNIKLQEAQSNLDDIKLDLNDAEVELYRAKLELTDTNTDLKNKKSELSDATKNLDKAKTDLTQAQNDLEAITRPISGKIAFENLINTIADSGKETTVILGKNKGKPKTTFTFDGSLATAMMVFNAARDRAAMREREKQAMESRDKAIAQRNTAVAEKNKAVARLQGVEGREKNADTREKELADKEKWERGQKEVAISQRTAIGRQEAANTMYNQQLNLNQLYDEASKSAKVFEGKFKAEHEENIALRGELEGAYLSVSAMAKAVSCLEEDENFKLQNPTKNQAVLLKAIQQYGIRHTKAAGFEKIANDMGKYFGISKGLQQDIDELMPKPPVVSRDWGPSL